jgi:hypothetical protein
MLVDACVLINLLATDRIADIAARNDAAIVIVREVADEAFFLRPDNAGAARTPVDLNALCTAGIIEVIDLDDDELELFVAYAAVVDDGEAATISVGVRHALPVATDDRGARRLIARECLELELHNTTAMMRRWAETGVAAADVASALAAIEHRASFTPASGDPNYPWWRSACG